MLYQTYQFYVDASDPMRLAARNMKYFADALVWGQAEGLKQQVSARPRIALAL